MTQPDRSYSADEQRNLSRWRGALMAVLPKGHPVHDPTRAFSESELELFEQQFFALLDRASGGRSLRPE